MPDVPEDCIEVTLEERCEGDHGDYGVDVLYQDSSASSIIRFEQSDTICVPIVVGQTFSVRLYFNDDIVEQVDGLMAGMLYSPIVLVDPANSNCNHSLKMLFITLKMIKLATPKL